ncbi:MAG: hypothetical protein JXB26_17665 [Candidatus Aminicenantes bacterium]|nr:hypothetical protein [Candidatus Aminicenantes bacterium]
MKILTQVALVFLSTIMLFSQQETHDVSVINIEIPVRVFQGDIFVDDLSLKDFEVYEDGKKQKIEAVYLVKKTNIAREEGNRQFAPEVARNFILFFEITDFLPRIVKALDYFFENVIQPGDELTIITPIKTYHLKSRALEVKSKEEILDQLRTIIRRDTMIGSAEYRSAITELEKVARILSQSISEGQEQSTSTNVEEFSTNTEEEQPLDMQITRYRNLLSKMENIRTINQKKMMDFAEYLKEKTGQKYVYVFYEREYIPKIENRILNQYLYMHQGRPDVIHSIMDLFDFYKRSIPFNLDTVKRVYADSAISIHFLFITPPPPHISGITFAEQSEDIYSAFREMADSTGGLSDTSSNAEASLKRAIQASENYYLIYYTPSNYKRDGKFRKIEVKVKNRNLRVSFRAGYIAH